MPGIFNILLHTPWWVLCIFGLLVWLGLQARRPRVVPVWRLMLAPALFIGWGLIRLSLQAGTSPMIAGVWITAVLAGSALGLLTIRLPGLTIDRAQGLVSLPGSIAPLIRNLMIFSVLYGLGLATALLPAMRSELAIWNLALSGASSGYFLGWVVRFASIYRRSIAAPTLEQT